MVKVKPADVAAATASLVRGPAIAAAYEAKMTADKFAGCA
jgi:glycine cleavage system H protein